MFPSQPNICVPEDVKCANQFVRVVQTLGINARWGNTIADWVHDETGLGTSKQITFCVEGNIGAGKSTWLDMVHSNADAEHELIEVVPEPVHMWQNSPHGHNLLDLFYDNPEKHAFAFHQFVLVMRMQQVGICLHVTLPASCNLLLTRNGA